MTAGEPSTTRPMAQAVVQPMVRRRRGFFGLLFKCGFLLYNGLMLVWLVGYWVKVGPQLDRLGGAASRAGGALGALLGTGVIVGFWAAGALILGLFVLLTRR